VDTDHEVDCDLTYAPTSPLIRSLVHSSGDKTPHHHPSHRHHPEDPGLHRIRCLFPYGEQICYHVIDKYRYAVFIDVVLVGQALW
jgi:hypothetical protein